MAETGRKSCRMKDKEGWVEGERERGEGERERGGGEGGGGGVEGERNGITVVCVCKSALLLCSYLTTNTHDYSNAEYLAVLKDDALEIRYIV